MNQMIQSHQRGIRILMDLVPNHCSNDHAWFRAALAAPPAGIDDMVMAMIMIF